MLPVLRGLKAVANKVLDMIRSSRKGQSLHVGGQYLHKKEYKT